jgi:hypothetical protein
MRRQASLGFNPYLFPLSSLSASSPPLCMLATAATDYSSAAIAPQPTTAGLPNAAAKARPSLSCPPITPSWPSAYNSPAQPATCSPERPEGYHDASGDKTRDMLCLWIIF